MRLSRLAAVLLALLAAILGSCGGDGQGPPLGLEEYFRRAEEVDGVAAERFDRIGMQLEADLPEEEALAVFRDVFPEQVAALRDLLEGMDELNPPPEVRDLHEDAVDALRDFVDVSEETGEAIAGARSLADLTGVLSGQETVDAGNRLRETCLALEGAAADRGVTIDLDC